MQKIVIIFMISMLAACAGHQRETNKLANQLYQNNPQTILNQLQSSSPNERDYAQFHLNTGFLQFLVGDFPTAIETLTQAKKEMAVLEATSISENAAAGTVNETLRSYSGYPTDRVMVHNVLALSYLLNEDIDGARVEMLQADIAMKKLAKKKSLVGQFANTHLLSGIIYELLDEQSNALISYKNSESIIKARNLSVPVGLQQGLLRMSFAVDRDGQYLSYNKLYSGFEKPLQNSNNKVFAIYFDGVVSSKVEKTVIVPSGNDDQLIRISVPAYPQSRYRVSRTKLTDATQQISSELVENLEVSVREDLAKEYPSILLLTTTRAVAKYELVKEADKQDSLLGALVNLVTVLTEVADLRSWNMLPASVQFAYIETPDNQIIVNKNNSTPEQITLQKNSRNLLLISSLEAPIFHYQQTSRSL